nr:MAG TPA: hypothetical protein [Caudoviricetes sp.]
MNCLQIVHNLGETLALEVLTIPLMAIFGILLVHLAALVENPHFNHGVRMGSMFFKVVRISGDVGVNCLGARCARLATLGKKLMFITEFLIALFVCDSLERHEINVDELKFIQKFPTNGLAEVKTSVKGHDILYAIEIAEVREGFYGFLFADNCGQVAIGNSFLIQGEGALGVIILGNLVIMLHDKIGNRCDDVQVSVMDNCAQVIHTSGGASATHGFGIKGAIDSLRHEHGPPLRRSESGHAWH